MRTAAAIGPVLGIETGTPVVSVGVIQEGRLQASFARELPSHCSGLAGAVDECLAAAGLTLRDLAGIAVGVGPGSFTGLRVGLSYAKGLAQALGIALVGAPSLYAIALAARLEPRPDVSVCPVLDARRGEIYAALYRFSGDALKKVMGEFAASAAEIARALKGNVIFAGDAIQEEVRRLAAANGCCAVATGTSAMGLRGCAVAGIGASCIAEGRVDEAATLEPLYVRPAGAARSFRLGERDNGASRRGIDSSPRGS